MRENISDFEQRKKDHIEYALDSSTEAIESNDLDTFSLAHEALPDLDFTDINLETSRLSQPSTTPFLISSMTAGHENALEINRRLMSAAQHNGWAMGIGSQRRELFDKEAHKEWSKIRGNFQSLQILGNIGIAQCITEPVSDIQRLVDNLEANAMQIHLNALQECIQPEGTPSFKGSLKAIENLCGKLSVPVIIKETGCGISTQTMLRLKETGVAALDVSGLGGTHWGRIEGKRAQGHILQQSASDTFKNWGIGTLQAISSANELNLDYEIWASGGVRNGLDAAKLLAKGAQTVGFARPMLEAALESEETIIETMNRIEFELKVALFCTGNSSIKSLQEKYHVLPTP